MEVIVLDPYAQQRVLQERRASGTDKYDEVWDGVYMLMPLPNNEHQDLVTGLSAVFRFVVDWSGRGITFGGVNVTDREEDWTQNYREPDVAVFLSGNPARDCGSHWYGGPDFAVEIISPDDRSRAKLPFYASIATRELLLVDRAPWALELYHLDDGEMIPVGRSDLDLSTDLLVSAVLPLSFRLVPGEPRPRIEIAHSDGKQLWTV